MPTPMPAPVAGTGASSNAVTAMPSARRKGMKIPGFSSYLHIVVDENIWQRVKEVKLTINQQ